MVQQLLLLGVLLKGEMHGYRLNEYVKHAMNLYTDLKKSTSYYVLDKLEKEGYVQHEIEREGKRPERRVYQITNKGEAYFRSLLREHLQSYTRNYYADDVGIAFMDQLSIDEVHRLLVEKREKVQAALQGFLELPDHGKNLQYAINHNIAHLKADITWLDSVLNELNDTDA